MLVGLGILRDVAVLAAGAGELEEVLKEGDELVLAFAIGQEERKENGEVASAYEDFFGEILGELASEYCALGDVLQGGATKCHQLIS